MGCLEGSGVPVLYVGRTVFLRLIYHFIVLFPNLYTILFCEFYFLPFSVHAQTNTIYIALLSLLW
jgi:hypothetical protein